MVLLQSKNMSKYQEARKYSENNHLFYLNDK